jgi:hypothetical protein
MVVRARYATKWSGLFIRTHRLSALWNGHEHLGRFSLKFLLEMPLWAQSYPGSPLSVALLTETMMRLGLRKDLSTHVQSLRATSFPRLQNRPRILRSIVNMVASFAP